MSILENLCKVVGDVNEKFLNTEDGMKCYKSVKVVKRYVGKVLSFDKLKKFC